MYISQLMTSQLLVKMPSVQKFLVWFAAKAFPIFSQQIYFCHLLGHLVSALLLCLVFFLISAVTSADGDPQSTHSQCQMVNCDDILLCTNPICQEHKSAMDRYRQSICNCLKSAKMCIPTTTVCKRVAR